MHWMWKPCPPRCIITLLHRKWMKAQTSAGQCQEQLLAEPGSDPSPPNRSSQVRGTLDYVEWASTNLQSCSCLSWQSELRAETRLRDDPKNLKLTGSPEGSKKKSCFFTLYKNRRWKHDGEKHFSPSEMTLKSVDAFLSNKLETINRKFWVQTGEWRTNITLTTKY